MSGAVNLIRVDWVDTALWPGRLGLTFAPGKKGESLVQPGVIHDRDTAQDFETLAAAGVNVIAPLIEAWEFQALGMDGYEQEAERQGIQILPCEIVDGQVPTEHAAFGQFIDELMSALLNGQNVLVHCRGGLGRAGLTASCLLVQAGMQPDEATALVRRTRPGAVETAVQERCVREFGR